MSFFNNLNNILLIYSTIAFLLFLTIGGVVFLYLYRKKCNLYRSLDFVFLQVTVPKKESKEDQERERDQVSEIRKITSIAEHFFSTLHVIYDSEHIIKGQDFFSIEIIAHETLIKFFINCPRSLADLFDKQVTSFYPEAIVEMTESPHLFSPKTYQATAYLTTDKQFYIPFKTFSKFETSDPMNNILNSMSNASDGNGNSAAVQIMLRPVANNWQKDARHFSKQLAKGKSGFSFNPFKIIGNLLALMLKGAKDKEDKNETETTNDESSETTKAIEEKSEKVAFESIIRCITSSPEMRVAKSNLNNIVSSFSQFGSPSFNSFVDKKWHSKRKLIHDFLLRSFNKTWQKQHKMILSNEEICTFFHFPHIKYNNIPSIKWQNYKIVKAPSNIPKKGLLLGHNNYRSEKTPIYIKREDRFRHFYVIGQTGTGKSSIFQSMIRQDFTNGDGLCVVDPHGSLIEDLLPFIPKNRIDDVIIFDPSDLERPMGLNLLEANSEEEKDMVALDAMNIMIKMFDEETFGPRIQDYFRNGVLTLMANPDGGSLTDIVRLFTDDVFQRSMVKHVTNPVVKSFWTKQMAKTGAKEKQEMIPYFSAKFGAFVTNSMMRNIIGQTKSSFDFTDVMNKKKILLMNLSKGSTGEINSKLLGLIIVSKIQMAALRRQKQSKSERVDFFLYIDEFQNYVTDSIESILSEARKYRLSLNMAHQYISQIDTSNQKKGVNLKDAVFGNVGTMMCYKIGAQDAEHMAKEMAPTFTDQDLINIDKFKAVMKLSVDTQPSKPFSIIPTNPYTEEGDAKIGSALKQISRLTFGRAKKFVEREIFARLDI